jgi:hypothetical protein
MRITAHLAAGALAASALSVVGLAGPASAAAPSLTWQVSQQFTDHLSTHALTGGATESGGVVTFPGGTGSLDPETGAGTVEYDGSVAGSFAMAGTTYYTITIADPAVTVEPDGEGEITAVVSAWNGAAMGNPEAHTDPARVTVATFDSAGWADGALTATPDWADVLPPGAESAALGIPDGKPVDGKSFAPEFLGQLTSGTRAHFYASGSTSDAKKAPAAFTAGAAATPPAVDVVTSYAGASVTLDVSGSGFTATDGNPGDDGVYVGLAPAGGLPAVDDMDDMDSFAAVAWVAGSAIVDGRLTASLTAKGADLQRGTAYAVYTWRAHTHSTTSQDTETPVRIDWSKLKSPVALKLTLVKKPTTKAGGKLRVLAGDATGKVTATLKRAGKVGPKASALLKKNGKATLRLPQLVQGRWTVVVAYAGDAAHRSARKSVTFRV